MVNVTSVAIESLTPGESNIYKNIQLRGVQLRTELNETKIIIVRPHPLIPLLVERDGALVHIQAL